MTCDQFKDWISGDNLKRPIAESSDAELKEVETHILTCDTCAGHATTRAVGETIDRLKRGLAK